MRIYIDIAHPAYAHAFRHFIGEMEKRDHQILVSARDKDITQCLLKSWDIDFIDRGKGAASLTGKVSCLAGTTMRLLPLVRKFNPDLVMSWSSYHAAAIGRILGTPVITFEDTEDVPLLHKVNRLLSTNIITPACFEKDLGASHIRFNGYKELASLHPSRFAPPPLPPDVDQPFILLRFVSWGAYHDKGHPGISEKMKHYIAEKLSNFGRVYISSEDPLTPGLYKYRAPVDCITMHSLLAGASLFFGESASMAAEAAVLGVPSIYIDNAGRGYTRELENDYGLMFNFGEDEDSVYDAIKKAVELLKSGGIQKEWQQKRRKMLEDKIDTTAYMVELAENINRGIMPGQQS